MECPRGWMIAKNSNGIDVPFLIKTRNVDIYYSSTMSGKFEMADVFTEEEINNMDLTIVPPGQTYMFTHKGWYVWLNNNETFDIGTTIYMNTQTMKLSSDKTKLYCTINLPWKLLYDNILDINITKECDALDLKLAHFNIVMGTISEDRDVSSFTLEIYKHNGGTFSDSCLSDPHYRNSMLRIRVTGMAQLGEYAQIDTKENIGISWDPSANLVGSGAVMTRIEVQNMINALRNDIIAGRVVTPRDIMDLVNDPVDAQVMDNGYILDIDENSQTVAAALLANEIDEVASSSENFESIDLSDLGL